MKTLLFLLIANIFIACNSSDKKIRIETTQKIKTQVAFAQNLDTVGLNYKPLKYFKGDTVAYLKENFSKNKAYYLGKKFSVFKNNLELPIIQFFPDIDNRYENQLQPITKGISINFVHFDSKTYFKNKRKIFFWDITFQKPLSYPKVLKLAIKNNRKWTKEVDDYFNDRIIGDL